MVEGNNEPKRTPGEKLFPQLSSERSANQPIYTGIPAGVCGYKIINFRPIILYSQTDDSFIFGSVVDLNFLRCLIFYFISELDLTVNSFITQPIIFNQMNFHGVLHCYSRLQLTKLVCSEPLTLDFV